MRRQRLLMMLLLLGLASGAQAQDPAQALLPQPTPDEAQAYQEALQDAEPLPGLLNLYRKKDQLLCELGAEHLDHAYLMFTTVRTGIGQGFLVSGVSVMEEWMVAFHRQADKIEFRRLNTRFFSSMDTQLSGVVMDSYHDSLTASLPLVAENTAAGTVLVDLSGVFFQDLAGLASILQSEIGLPYFLDPTRSAWGKVRVFPLNVELDVQNTFATNISYDLGTISDSRAVPLTVHYSVAEPPDSSTYLPRLADERVGYFVTAMKDISKADDDPFIRLITRWRLEKANPQAASSPPKQPILIYIDESIPYAYRPAVRRGLLEWNKAFEKIGILDAIEVRSKPEDPDWDPDDIRYSSVRWGTDAAFKGINSRSYDPRTGQIFDTEILINAESFRAYAKNWRLAPAPPKARRIGGYECTLAEGFSEQLGLATLVQGTPPADFLDAAVKYLAMHEFGHALGLRHNFKGSSTIPIDKLQDAAYTREHGLSGSILDYPAVNLAPPGQTQGEYFPSTLGAYDYWAIEYGYKPILGPLTAVEELPELEKVAARSTEPELAFATDEDYYSAYNPDPYTNQFDLGSEPLIWARQQFELVQSQLNETLADRVLRDGERYQILRRTVHNLLGLYFRAMNIASRYVGGYEVRRLRKGQSTELTPMRPVSASLQKEALRFLADVAFADRFTLPARMLQSLAPETWTHWGMPAPDSTTSDYPIEQTLWAARSLILDRLLSQQVLERVQNAELAVDEDAERLTLDQLMDEARRAAWNNLESTTPQGRALQRQHLDILIRYALRPQFASADVRNLARLQLAELAKVLEAARTTEPLTAAHHQECLRRIRQALEARGEIAP